MPSVFDIFTDLKPRSVLPAGGTPQTDREYLEWRRAFVEAENARWLDRATRFGEELPGRELILPWLMDEEIYRASGGSRLFEAPNYQHLIRHLGIIFREKRPLVIRAAQQYAARNAAHLCEVAR